MIRFALIGVGHFGKNYLRLLQDMPDVELAVIAATSENSFKNIIVSDSVQKTTNPEGVFRNPGIDAVIVATPTPSHFSLASAALKAGKHVHVEKPMTATLAEAEELAKIAGQSGKIFLVGHQYLYNDHIRFLKQKLDEGFFGAIQYVHAEHFYTKPLLGTVGCFWETATHELAILDYLFGEFSVEKKRATSKDFYNPVRSQTATSSAVSSAEQTSNGTNKRRDDFASVSFLLSGKFPVSVVTSWYAPEKVRKFTIVGERGATIFDEIHDPKNPLRLYEIGSDIEAYKEVPVAIKNQGEPLRNELQHFISCIEEHKTPLTDYHHGLRITKYLDILTRS